jgi:hypothetical protein
MNCFTSAPDINWRNQNYKSTFTCVVYLTHRYEIKIKLFAHYNEKRVSLVPVFETTYTNLFRKKCTMTQNTKSAAGHMSSWTKPVSKAARFPTAALTRGISCSVMTTETHSPTEKFRGFPKGGREKELFFSASQRWKNIRWIVIVK